jgi:hypothetical protein
MYTLRSISVYLGYILSILVMCDFSAVVRAEELPEILRGPTTPITCLLLDIGQRYAGGCMVHFEWLTSS